MSELIAAPADPQDLIEEPEHVLERMSQPPVLITEQEVAFSTAAAVRLPRTKPTRRVIAGLRVVFLGSSEGPPSAQHHYLPRREAFIEEAAMKREMHRL